MTKLKKENNWKFSPLIVLKYIKTVLNLNYNEENEYEITETAYNESTYASSPNLILKKSWLVKFFPDDDDEFYTVFNYDTYYVPSTYVIKILFLEDSDNTILKFYNCGSSRTKFCYNAISIIKYFIREKEREIFERFLKREAFLLLINNSINNYDNFNKEDLQQVRNEKLISKKRNVLEDPMYSREVLQYL